MKLKFFIVAFLPGLFILHCGLDKLLLEEAPVLAELSLSTYTADPGDTIQAVIAVERANGDALLYDWSVTGGTILPPENHDTVYWKVPFTGGLYNISIEVTNEHDKSSSVQQNITVRSYEVPQVEIVSPASGAHFAQYATIPVKVHASHQNGIAHVSLYINDLLQVTVEGKSNATQYDFSIELNQPPGNIEIKAEATGTLAVETGMDSVIIMTEGVVLGK